jgi:HK97 gp10 family phage protein
MGAGMQSNAADVARRLRDRLDSAKIVRSGLAVGVAPFVNEAKRTAPFNTGQLRRNIQSRVVEATSGRAVAVFGNTKAVPYAKFMEFGTRRIPPRAYLRGSARSLSVRAAAITAMTEAIKTLIRTMRAPSEPPSGEGQDAVS